jgi:hypothetical protein
MRRRIRLGATAFFVALPAMARAQSVAQRVAGAPDGHLTMQYSAREGVCRNGDGIHIGMDTDDEEPGSRTCPRTTVQVRLTIQRSRVTEVESEVGTSDWPAPATRLGTVPAAGAAAALLAIARTADSAPARDAIHALALADSATIWPDLLDLARDRTRPGEVRGAALFWVGQEAGARVTRDMAGFAEDASEDREVRQIALFGLGRRAADESVPVLLRVARQDRDPEIRRMAIFWLSRTHDPRAIGFFEEVLTR